MDGDRTLSDEDRAQLGRAQALLNADRLLVRLAGRLGKGVEETLDLVPPVRRALDTATHKALQGALWMAVRTTGKDKSRPSWDRAHIAGSMVLGAAGGFFGLPAMALEDPATTVAILRSILEIARSEGADITDPAIKVECLNVFALGGPSPRDDDMDVSYFTTRASLAPAAAQVAQYIAAAVAKKELMKKLTVYLGKVGARYAMMVAEKVASQGAPIIGAVGGSVINAVFMDYYQDIARGHFIILRLERKYGAELVRSTYESVIIEKPRPRLMWRK